ncbi:Amine oxidase [Mycena sanguinolenta]|uniref:Amine oxidase n=1 Tax=Mycena sanguinolenta TaxID=230812 RepID=A0A8H6YN72_9AGAR|nr:Amine oxidase [Mycena sanguinolenta]
MRQISWLLILAATTGITLAPPPPPKENHRSVLILGGGVAGIIAARTLHEQGIDDFLIVEARDELGGRLRSKRFGADNRRVTVELGANWIQGTQEGNGPTNPILALARKHGLKAAESDFYDSMVTYDETGPADYLDVFNKAVADYTTLTVAGGARVQRKQVDSTCRTGYSIIGSKPKTPHEMVSEYYMFVRILALFLISTTLILVQDWEYAQTPEQTSWIASSWASGFSDGNLFSIDQRGFKHFIQAEAATFLTPEQTLLNATVRNIAHSADGVIVTLADGTNITADYAITTFSIGVLQNDDILFEPPLPTWKQEAIQTMTMGTYTKIFLQFEDKFWFDTQFALYADRERGRYPVWQGLDLENFMPGSGIVFATVTGDYSQRIERMSDAEVQAEVLEVLRTMFPNTTIPTPTAFFFPRWFSDPLYRGSFSNWPSGFVSPHHTNIRANIGQRLWFAGEGTSQKYFGFLHGAYFEGLDIGKRVANCLNTCKCASLPFTEEVLNATPYVA